MPKPIRKLLFFAICLFCLTAPAMTSAWALVLGLVFGGLMQHPFPDLSRHWTPKLLTYAVVGLGASVNLELALRVGASGFLYTALGIGLTLLLGLILGRVFKQNDRIAVLLSVGTAICGGSAIAAVAPVIRAKQEEISIAIGVVFILNAASLFLFPSIGHALHLTQEQFGMWAALAIHDTSSVVGATLAYGDTALRIGTTIKLARALWIVPVTFLTGMLWAKYFSEPSEDGQKPARKYPWFILGFLAMAALATWVPMFAEIGHGISDVAKRVMILSLFLIGSNLNISILKGLGLKSVMHAVLLWLIVAATTLFCIMSGIIPTHFE